MQSDSPFAYAWGEPPVVLVCGVDRPAGFVVGVSAIQINGVQWYVDTSDPDDHGVDDGRPARLRRR